jgi:hypothetical protein
MKSIISTNLSNRFLRQYMFRYYVFYSIVIYYVCYYIHICSFPSLVYMASPCELYVVVVLVVSYLITS